MTFVWVCIGMIVVLGVIALVANRFDKGEDTIVKGHDCSTCTEADKGECKIHCLLEDKGRQRKIEEDRGQMISGRSSTKKVLSFISFYLLLTSFIYKASGACES